MSTMFVSSRQIQQLVIARELLRSAAPR